MIEFLDLFLEFVSIFGVILEQKTLFLTNILSDMLIVTFFSFFNSNGFFINFISFLFLENIRTLRKSPFQLGNKQALTSTAHKPFKYYLFSNGISVRFVVSLLARCIGN